MWKSLYSVVTMSNNVIYACNNKASEGCSDSIKVRCIAEARLMRAQAYFYMVRLWGPCILLGEQSGRCGNAGASKEYGSGRL